MQVLPGCQLIKKQVDNRGQVTYNNVNYKTKEG